MGRETKTFRQTKKSGSADYANKAYARTNRAGGWGKFVNVFKKGGKVRGHG